MDTNPCVVFRPTTPQHAAGTRMEPAVSVPKATSANPLETATAEPQDDPPGISLLQLLNGLFGTPKYSLNQEGATAIGGCCGTGPDDVAKIAEALGLRRASG